MQYGNYEMIQETVGFNFKIEGVTHFSCPLRAVDNKGKTYVPIN